MSELLRVFIGWDHRQPVSYTVLQHSIYTLSSKPVAITPLVLPQLPLKRQGLTPFTYSRFLVPYLCDYKGWALFLDIDMVLRDDIAKLFNFRDDKYAVMVSKNNLRFEWASAMLFNCEKCKILTPEYIETASAPHKISWANEDEIGAFPNEWNHLVGYDRPNPDAKLVHYTQGVPAFEVTADSEHASAWTDAHKAANTTAQWDELMGPSVHAATLSDGRRVPRYKVENPAHAS